MPSSYHLLLTANQKIIKSCGKKATLEFPGNLGPRHKVLPIFKNFMKFTFSLDAAEALNAVLGSSSLDYYLFLFCQLTHQPNRGLKKTDANFSLYCWCTYTEHRICTRLLFEEIRAFSI